MRVLPRRTTRTAAILTRASLASEADPPRRARDHQNLAVESPHIHRRTLTADSTGRHETSLRSRRDSAGNARPCYRNGPIPTTGQRPSVYERPLSQCATGSCGQLTIESRCLEGLGSLSELLFANALAIAEGVDVEEALLVLDSAAPAAGRVVDGDEDLLPGVDELLGNRLLFIPRAVPALPHGPDLLPPTGRKLLTDFVHDVSGQALRRLCVITAPVAIEEAPDDLDVCLRHAQAVSR